LACSTITMQGSGFMRQVVEAREHQRVSIPTLTPAEFTPVAAR
jgi:hypothetical protein